MAFWSKWFAPKCQACAKVIEGEPVTFEEQTLCAACHQGILAERERAEQERRARRQAEEEALRKLEERQTFGPRPPLGE